MFKFVTISPLRDLGTRMEFEALNEAAANLNSIDYYAAALCLRFFNDASNPILIIKIPKTGYEPIKDMIFEKDYDVERFKSVMEKALLAAEKCLINVKVYIQLVGEDNLVIIKDDFLYGDWSNYMYEIQGDRGNSIGRKRRGKRY